MKFSSTYQPVRVPLTDRRYKVFVYGSLRQGFGNHTILKESPTTKFIGYATIRAKLFTAHWGWPHIIFSRSNNDHVIGELYTVDHITFERLDRLEGYDKKRRFGGCLFYRKRVIATLSDIKGKGFRKMDGANSSLDVGNIQFNVWVYEGGDSLKSRGEHIASGDWKAAKTAYDKKQRPTVVKVYEEDEDDED